MKAISISLIFLLTLLNTCDNKNEEKINLTSKNNLNEKQLKTISFIHDKYSATTNTVSRDSIDIGTNDPLPPCPDNSFTDCCPSLKYITFKKGTKKIKIELLDSNNEVVQTFDESDLTRTKDGTLVLPLKSLRESICSGKYKLNVKKENEKPYTVKFLQNKFH